MLHLTLVLVNVQDLLQFLQSATHRRTDNKRQFYLSFGPLNHETAVILSASADHQCAE